jgi:hypothetical protein
VSGKFDIEFRDENSKPVVVYSKEKEGRLDPLKIYQVMEKIRGFK